MKKKEFSILALFKVGQTVKLKSGGPLMTVKVLKNGLCPDDDGNIYDGFCGFIVCSWFDPITNELKSEIFKQEMLESSENSESPLQDIPVIINKHI